MNGGREGGKRRAMKYENEGQMSHVVEGLRSKRPKLEFSNHKTDVCMGGGGHEIDGRRRKVLKRGTRNRHLPLFAPVMR